MFSDRTYHPTSRLFFFYMMAMGLVCWHCNNPATSKEAMEEGARIPVLIQQLKSPSYSPEEKQEFLKAAYALTLQEARDSVTLGHWSTLCFQAYKLQDSASFFAIGQQAYDLAVSLKDTLKIADMHWNYGAYHLRALSYDSAYVHYQKAHKLFKTTDASFLAARMLYNMAFILSRLRDYTGTEVYLFQAIEIFKPLEKHRQLYQCYNLLGVVYEELEDYDRALYYHRIALEHLDLLDDPELFLQDSYNNIGLIYQKQGQQQEAIAYFDQALALKNLRRIDPFLYARLVDNKAYSQFLKGDFKALPKAFFEALHIRDSMQTPSGVIMSRTHLAAFYAKQGDTAMALTQVTKAYHIAQEIKNNRDILLTLDLLASLDPPRKPQYLEAYIRINRQVQVLERNTRNKFTRIQYETDQYIARNKALNTRATWTMIGGFVCFFVLFLMYLIYRQQSQNKLLLLESNQQQANEKIYRLTLQQQEQLQQGRNQERIRIAEDLHDSILSDLFAIRMGWSYLGLQGSSQDLSQHSAYLIELQRLEKKIRTLSHELKNNMIEHPIDFKGIVKRLVQKRSQLGGFQYQLTHNGNIPWEAINNLIKVNLYHIIEEALQNCIKHAKASNFSLHFIWYDQTLTLEMRDDGRGTDRPNHRGIGIQNMRSRVKQMGGKYTWSSQPNEGTKITIRIPIIFKT